MKKFTVIGRFDDGETYVEHVEAEDPKAAFLAAYATDTSREDSEPIACFEGWHNDVLPPEATYSTVVAS